MAVDEVLKDNTNMNVSELKSENNEPAKKASTNKVIVMKEEEKMQDKLNLTLEIPAEDSNHNNKVENLSEDHIKSEPASPRTLKVCETPESEDRTKMKRNIEETEPCAENPDVKKLKTEQNGDQRRRSLRNETAATIKKKPQKYEEIFGCYKRKEYKECIIYIDLVSESGGSGGCVEYLILKAACLIHLGIKIIEAHKILDDILKSRPDNAFTVYAKGLACYHEEKWKESIKYFEKAISIDQSSMQRAEVMMKKAKEELEKAKLEEENNPEVKIEEESNNNEENGSAGGGDEEEEENDENDDDDDNSEDDFRGESKDVINKKNKRFGCELCGKYFGKKFNLDRHNRTIHNRQTPYIAPLPRNYNRKAENEVVAIKKEKEVILEVEEEEEEEIADKMEVDDETVEEDDDDENYVDIEEEEEKSKNKSKPSKFKIRLGGAGGNNSSGATKSKSYSSLAVKSGMARCKVCKKMYRKGSLARHEIIHTGNKMHKCEDCDKSFYQKSDLQRHIVSFIINFIILKYLINKFNSFIYLDNPFRYLRLRMRVLRQKV